MRENEIPFVRFQDNSRLSGRLGAYVGGNPAKQLF